MKNTLFRRVTAGTFAAVAAVGLSTLFATAASAHSVGPHGSADCGSDGQYTITWTVENDWGTKVTLSNVKVGGYAIPGASTTLGVKGSATAKKTFTTKHAGETQADVVLTGDARWEDGPDKLWPENGPLPFNTKVHLKGDCEPTTTPSTPAPSSPAPSTSRTPEASRSSSPSLPVTGSSSTMPLVGTGAALVAGGAVLIVTLRRRRRVTFTAE